MTVELPLSPRPERRAADAMPIKFEGAALKNILPAHASLDDLHVETIDMDAALPPGHDPDDHLQPVTSSLTATQLTPEQNRGRLQIVKFKHSLDGFEVSQVSQVTVSTIKRGDVIEIKTIVGGIYLRVIDRIKGTSPGVGEVLCECRYDLQDQWALAHAASIGLPLCSKSHVIINPDGSQRLASRSLKMTADIELPEQVKSLMRENFFVEIKVHANPEPEKLRLVDIWRWLKRVALKLKAIIDNNNRKEREKALQKELKKQQKEEARRRKLEEKQGGNSA